VCDSSRRVGGYNFKLTVIPNRLAAEPWSDVTKQQSVQSSPVDTSANADDSRSVLKVRVCGPGIDRPADRSPTAETGSVGRVSTSDAR